MKSGRFPRSGGSRFGTFIGTGVPTNNGGGSFVLSGTWFCASAAEDTTNIVNAIPCFIIFILYLGLHFIWCDVDFLLCRNGFIRLVDHILARERFIGRAVQLASPAHRREK